MSESHTAKVTMKVTEPGRESIIKTPTVLSVEYSEDHHQARVEAISILKKEQSFPDGTTFEVVDVEYIESFDDFLKRQLK